MTAEEAYTCPACGVPYIDHRGLIPICRELQEAKEKIAIALSDNPEMGDYSKTAMNFHDAWMESRAETERLREQDAALRLIADTAVTEMDGWQERSESAERERDRYRELMQEFCDRVDKREIRSKRTYAKFKQALEGKS